MSHVFHDGSLAAGAGNVPGTVMELAPYQQQVVTVQISQIGTNAVVNFEGSMDNVTFAAVRAFNQADGTGATTAAAVRIVRLETGFRFLRCRVSAQTAGSTIVTGRAVFGSMGTP